jgi:hypothetical protein
VFQSSRDGTAEIYLMNSNGTGQTRLTNNPAFDSNPVWSPDGTKILFTSTRDDPMKPALYLMNADGSNQQRVTNGSNGVWRSLPAAPVIFAEEGTNNAAALDSVTFVRGPFSILNSHNFSGDGHTRIIILTSDLRLSQQQNPAPSVVSVQAGGVTLSVENVGPLTGISASYVVVKLPDGLPAGNLSLTLTVRGLTSAATNLSISP